MDADSSINDNRGIRAAMCLVICKSMACFALAYTLSPVYAAVHCSGLCGCGCEHQGSELAGSDPVGLSGPASAAVRGLLLAHGPLSSASCVLQCTAPGNVDVDVSINDDRGIRAAKWLVRCQTQWPALRPLVLLLKAVLRVLELHDVSQGAPSTPDVISKRSLVDL